MLTYHKGDEKPAWLATITVNGVSPDYSSGHTYTVRVATSLTATAALTKTTGITGATGGVVTVAWAAGELDIAAGEYVAVLTIRTTSGTLDATVSEPLKILSVPA